jgi:hypothetical protein
MGDYIPNVIGCHDQINNQQVQSLREEMHESHYYTLAHIEPQFSLGLLHLILILVQIHYQRDKAISRDPLSNCHVPFNEIEHFNNKGQQQNSDY